MRDDHSLIPDDAKRPRGPYQISARLRIALEALANGKVKTQLEACELASITPRAMQKALKREGVRAYLQETIRSSLGISAQRAARRLHDLIDSDNAMVSFRASTYALGAGAGVVAPNANSPGISVNVSTNVGYVIDLRPQEPGPRGDGALLDEGDAAHISPVGGVLLD